MQRTTAAAAAGGGGSGPSGGSSSSSPSSPPPPAGECSVVIFFFAREKLLFRYPTENPFTIDLGQKQTGPQQQQHQQQQQQQVTAATASAATAAGRQQQQQQFLPLRRPAADDGGGSNHPHQQQQLQARAPLRRPASSVSVPDLGPRPSAGADTTTHTVTSGDGVGVVRSPVVASPPEASPPSAVDSALRSGSGSAVSPTTTTTASPASATARRGRLTKNDRSFTTSLSMVDSSASLTATVTTTPSLASMSGSVVSRRDRANDTAEKRSSTGKTVTIAKDSSTSTTTAATAAVTANSGSSGAAAVVAASSGPGSALATTTSTCVGIHVNALLHLLRVSLQGCTTLHVGSGTLLVFPICNDSSSSGGGGGRGKRPHGYDDDDDDDDHPNSAGSNTNEGSGRSRRGGKKASKASTAMLVVAMRQPDTDDGAIARFVQCFVNILCREERRAQYVSAQIGLMEELTAHFNAERQAAANNAAAAAVAVAAVVAAAAASAAAATISTATTTTAAAATGGNINNSSAGNSTSTTRGGSGSRRRTAPAGMPPSFSTRSFGRYPSGSADFALAANHTTDVFEDSASGATRLPAGAVGGGMHHRRNSGSSEGWSGMSRDGGSDDNDGDSAEAIEEEETEEAGQHLYSYSYAYDAYGSVSVSGGGQGEAYMEDEDPGVMTMRSPLASAGGTSAYDSSYHYSGGSGGGWAAHSTGVAAARGVSGGSGRSCASSSSPQAPNNTNANTTGAQQQQQSRSSFDFLAECPRVTLCREMASVANCINRWCATARRARHRLGQNGNNSGGGNENISRNGTTEGSSPLKPRAQLPDGILINKLLYLPLSTLTATGFGSEATPTGRSAARYHLQQQFSSVYGRLNPCSLLRLAADNDGNSNGNLSFPASLRQPYVDAIGKKYARLLPLAAVHACLISLAPPWRVGAFYRSLERALVESFRQRQQQSRLTAAARGSLQQLQQQQGQDAHAPYATDSTNANSGHTPQQQQQQTAPAPLVDAAEREVDVMNAIKLHYAAGFTYLAMEIIEFLRLRRAIAVDPESGLWFTHGEVVAAEAMESQRRRAARRARKQMAAGREGRAGSENSSNTIRDGDEDKEDAVSAGRSRRRKHRQPATLPSTLVLHMLTVMTLADEEGGREDGGGGLGHSGHGSGASMGGGGIIAGMRGRAAGGGLHSHSHGVSPYSHPTSAIGAGGGGGGLNTPSTGGTPGGNFPPAGRPGSSASPSESDATTATSHGARGRHASVETSLASTPSYGFQSTPGRDNTAATATAASMRGSAGVASPSSGGSTSASGQWPGSVAAALHARVQATLGPVGTFLVHCGWGSACPLCEQLAASPRAWTVPAPGAGAGVSGVVSGSLESPVALLFPFLDPSVVVCAQYMSLWKALGSGGGGGGGGMRAAAGLSMAPESQRPWFLKPEMYLTPAPTHGVSTLQIYRRLTAGHQRQQPSSSRGHHGNKNDEVDDDDDKYGHYPRHGNTADQQQQYPHHARPRQFITAEDEEGSVLLSTEAVAAGAKAWLRRFAATIEGRLDLARRQRQRLEIKVAEAVVRQLAEDQRARGVPPAAPATKTNNANSSEDGGGGGSGAGPVRGATSAIAIPVVAGAAATATAAGLTSRGNDTYYNDGGSDNINKLRAAAAAAAVAVSPPSPQWADGGDNSLATPLTASTAVGFPAPTAAGGVGGFGSLLGGQQPPPPSSPPMFLSSSAPRPRSLRYSKRQLPDRSAISPVSSLRSPLLGLRDAYGNMAAAAHHPAASGNGNGGGQPRSSSSVAGPATPDTRGGGLVAVPATAAAPPTAINSAAYVARAQLLLLGADRFVPVEVLVQFAAHHLVALTWGLAGVDVEICTRQIERNLRRLRPFLANFAYVRQLRAAGWTSRRALRHARQRQRSGTTTTATAAVAVSSGLAEEAVADRGGAATTATPVPVTPLDIQLLQTYEVYDALSLLPCLSRCAGRPVSAVPTRLLLHTAVNEFSDMFLLGSGPSRP